MRPLLLEMTAFGPFPTTQKIDFTTLGDNPLFLINGPTGSGKTTILDAICFALYGKTTGDERDGAQMRCDLAAAETLCQVIFNFELNGRYYQISRVPEQQRPKARGDGFTEQKPTAQLTEVDAKGDDNDLIATKVSDVTRAVESLTGLSVDQFRQVMILPQGKFRQLLLAESAEREKIFSKLFQTQIYKQLENRLKEQAAQVRRQRDDLRQQQLGILEAIEIESVEKLTVELTELQPQVKTAFSTKQQAEGAFLEKTKHLQQGEVLRAEFRQLDEIEGELKRLNERQEQIEQQRQQLTSALEAEKLKPFFVEQQRCVGEVERITETQRKLQQQLKIDEEKLQHASQQLSQTDEITQNQDRCKAELVQLDEQKGKLSKVETLRQQIIRLQQRVDTFAQLNQLREKEQHLQQMTQLAKLTSKLSKLTQRLDDEKKSGLKLKQLQEEQDQSLRQLELLWHRGQAAILAANLEEGQPCPVCGGIDHPAPAHSDDALPSQNELETLREKLLKTTTQLEDAREQYRQTASECELLKAQHDELEQQIEPGLDGDTLTAEVSLLQRELALNTVAAEIAELPAEKLTDQQLEEQRRLTAVETEISLLERELPEEYRRLIVLQQREERVRQQLDDLERQRLALIKAHQQTKDQFERSSATLNEVSRQLEELQLQLKTSTQAAEAALVASCFDAVDQYRQALLDGLTREQLQTSIDTFNDRLQQLTGAHEQLQRSLKGKAQPDLDKLQAELLQAENEKRCSESEWKRLDSRLETLLTTQKKLDENRQRLQKLDDRYAVVGTLSDVANGQTGQRISLQRFVLSVLLDDVLLVASERFSLMSKGRYQLLRSEDRNKGNRASGLNLLVDDAYTGKVRPVATLSGGESFMAALSLALGLSDVVQAHAGGIHLDTLFIDEGFGSLDPESLDLAVRTLVDLQSSGRMIGVISHVADLKEQIPLRIDVAAERTGSTIKVINS